MLMSSVLELSVDGTGSVEHRSRLSQDEQRKLLWRCDTPGELQIYQAHEDYPYPENEDDWDVFRYQTDWRRFDSGSGPVLVNHAVEDGWLVKNGFWTLASPIQLVSRGNNSA